MPVTFNINFSRLLARMERAQANRDRKRVARRLEKERLGIEDPALRGVWRQVDKGWAVAVRGKVAEVGERIDIAVWRHKDRTWGHIRGAEVIGYMPWYDDELERGPEEIATVALPDRGKR